MRTLAAEQFAVELARVAHDNKCEEVTVMDLRGRSSVTDFFVICTGTSDRQMRSTTEEMRDFARKLAEKPFRVSGYEHAAWILIDFVDVVVHVFTNQQRHYYDLELLWGDAPRVNWARSATA